MRASKPANFLRKKMNLGVGVVPSENSENYDVFANGFL